MLASQEQNELIKLMGKVTFPLPPEVFSAWCLAFPTIAAELAVMRNNDGVREIFLTYREDEFFKGWHIPGSIHLPNEKFEDTLDRVITSEMGMSSSTPYEFYRWFQYQPGNGIGESPRGDVITLMFVCEKPGNVEESDIAKFFPLTEMPEDLLLIHIPIIQALKERYDFR
ncbi:MAG: NUDIX domain-containing protein [Candidatus Paceibacterota bacterium]